MAKSTFIAPFAVAQSTTSVDAQIKFFGSIEYVVDEGYEALEEVPDEWFSARGKARSDLKKSVALRLPNDPYMHLILYEWSSPSKGGSWPAPFDQLGSRGCSLLVGNVTTELQRLRTEFPDMKVLHGPITVQRKWGKTTTALALDPDGLYVELTEIEKGSKFDPANTKPAPPGARTWLHFMHNIQEYDATSKFYRSFGLEHDHGVDFRPNVGFHPHGFDRWIREMKEAFDYDVSGGIDGFKVDFLRGETDCSQMHIELLGYPFAVKNPDAKPTWGQRGISRYCIKTKDYAGALKKAKADGHKIYIEDQRGCLNWGDSQWFFFADTDGNIVTLEEWFPQREWGERE